MKTPLLMLAIAAASALTMAPANAQERGQMDFETLDLNNDGSVTLEEMEAARTARFADADTDGDGALSEAELLARATQATESRAATMVERMLERLDANEDGLLQADEMPERAADRAERMFGRADANDDGVLSAEEFEKVAEGRGGRGGKARGDGKGHDQRPGRG